MGSTCEGPEVAATRRKERLEWRGTGGEVRGHRARWCGAVSAIIRTWALSETGAWGGLTRGVKI